MAGIEKCLTRRAATPGDARPDGDKTPSPNPNKDAGLDGATPGGGKPEGVPGEEVASKGSREAGKEATKGMLQLLEEVVDEDGRYGSLCA